MNRFKFRVWDIKEENYIEGLDIVRLTQYGTFVFNNAENNTEPALNPNRFIFEQCTGIKDKNDKLIYEGDIVTDGVDVFEVVWDYNAWCIQTNKFQHFLTEGFEVIGNIHENKGLLREQGEWHIEKNFCPSSEKGKSAEMK